MGITVSAFTMNLFIFDDLAYRNVYNCFVCQDCTDKEAEFIAPEVPKPQPVPTEPQQSTASSSKANISTIGSKLPNNLESSGCSEKIQSDREDNEDDDALKYVREIFFS